MLDLIKTRHSNLQAAAEEKGDAARAAEKLEKARQHCSTMLQRGFLDMFITVHALKAASKPKKKKKGDKKGKKKS